MKTLIIDIRPLLPKNPPGGVPEYTRQITKAMLGIIKKKQLPLRVFLFSSGSEKPQLDFLAPRQKHFYHYHLNVPNRLLNASFKTLNYPKIDNKILNTKYKIQDTIFFAPNINLFPLSRRATLVVTFHDLSFERYPFFLKRRERMWHRAINPSDIASRADKIIAVSESTKQDLISLYEVEPRKIEVIYSGVGDEFKPKIQDTRYPPSPRLRRAGKLQAILYLGSQEGRKNVEVLKRAFTMVKRKLARHNLRLMLMGPPQNPVSSQKRLELYQNASLFVYPSVFEGFGLPPLEAMACGVPVITSNTSSLPEAVCDAALMVNPHKVYELASAMESLLTDEKLRSHYIQKGLERVKEFSWERTAEQTLKVLLT
ncbi:MAG: glycosyltransferase family 4 protein [Candidatus Portnoybacteria bacterium]|nr:glycosyltransferase family 4 protein [Candidatus Portnoybacteria bacterium]